MRVDLPAADGIPRVIIPTQDGMKLECGGRLLEGEILMFAFTGMDDDQRGQKVQYHLQNHHQRTLIATRLG